MNSKLTSNRHGNARTTPIEFLICFLGEEGRRPDRNKLVTHILIREVLIRHFGLRQDGILKLIASITTMEEVLRVS